MNIKNKLKEAGILIGVFIVAVLVFSYFTNKGNDNMTADIGTATFPKIGFDCGGYGINAVPGYAQSMDIPTIRDTITPVLSGKLNVEINAYENAISSMEYKVYSLDGTEAFLEKKIKKPGKTEMLDLNKSGLLDEERVLEIILNYNKEKTVHFYTRIADEEKADIQQCLDYVTTFHNGALNKEEGVGVGKAIEPNEDGDNSTFAHVTIHSNYDQVSYGELEPKLEGGERWEIKEMNDTSSSIQAEFIVRCKGEENEDDLYKVREFFRVRYDSYAKRGYLLDYDRTMEQIFDPTKKVLSEKGVLLGISEYDIPYLNDKDGSIVSFVQADDLWSYNKETDEVSLVFSFAASENTDERNLTNQHEIQLLEADGNGNVTFAVYGYMNRGEHEGQVGVAVYYYNVEQSSVEEKVFIPTDTSWGNAIHELGKLVYYSVDREMLYVLAGDTFYETNVENEKTKELVTGLTEDHYVVSSDGRLLAYQSKSGENGANELTIMNVFGGIKMSLNSRFKEVRKILKQTQKQYAEELGISQAHLSNIENERDNPSLSLVKLVCVKFGVSEEWLTEEKGEIFSKYNGFDIVTDEGLRSKYQIMKDILEKQIAEQTGDNLKNIVQAYSHFVSLATMPGLTDENQENYLEALCSINSALEQIAYNSYMLKTVSDSNYKALLQHKTKIDTGISRIDENIKKALSCYLVQYGKDLTL